MRQHRVLFTVLLCGVVFVSLAGCTTAPSTDTWAVISERRAEETGIGTWLSSGAAVEGYWTPAKADILLLEEKLPSFLQENSQSFRREPPVWEQLDSYKRQYAGLVLNGRNIIYGNFFCSDVGADWKKEWIFVMDGGDCFFQLQFDTVSSTFSGLMVNGDA
jgi:hypothetical protein